jgi:hypothetical protein
MLAFPKGQQDRAVVTIASPIANDTGNRQAHLSMAWGSGATRREDAAVATAGPRRQWQEKSACQIEARLNSAATMSGRERGDR